jgi:pimeloyl-ACP methyl ester carboxylesterase
MVAEVSNVTLANGLTLSYAEQGGRAQPTVVLLPGATDSLWSYQPVLGWLPTSIRAVAVSPRGHGDSDKPATGYRVEDFASDVVPLLDALDIERAVLAGHSSSCLVIRRVAIDAPDRVAGLVLEASPTTLCGHAGLESFVQSVVSGLADPIDPALARAFVVDTSSDQLGAELIDTLVHEVMKVPARVWREMFGALLQYDDTAELPGISAPSLLIWGSADRLATREMQKELVRLLPGGRLLEYEGIGHTPRWENTARFASDLAAFAVLSGAGDDSG